MGMLRNPNYHDLIRHDDFELSMVAEEARDRIHLPILKRDVVGIEGDMVTTAWVIGEMKRNEPSPSPSRGRVFSRIRDMPSFATPSSRA